MCPPVSPNTPLLSMKHVTYHPLFPAPGGPRPIRPIPAADALAVYRLTLACLHDHLRARTAPDPAETAHVVRFACRGLRISVV